MSNNMKLTVEIVNDTFKYDYVVGKSKHHSEMPLSADDLILFAGLVRICREHDAYEARKAREQVDAAKNQESAKP